MVGILLDGAAIAVAPVSSFLQILGRSLQQKVATGLRPFLSCMSNTHR